MDVDGPSTAPPYAGRQNADDDDDLRDGPSLVGAKSTKMTWKPRKYKKKKNAETVEPEVKPEPVEEPEASTSRRRPELIHDTEGAFAQGPSMQAIKGVRKLEGYTPGRGDDEGGGGGASSWSRARTGPNEHVDDAPPPEGEDVDENKGRFEYESDSETDIDARRIRKNRLLDDIWREHEMAPIVPARNDGPAAALHKVDDARMDEDDEDEKKPEILIEETLEAKEARSRQSVADYLLANAHNTTPVYTVMQFPREFPEFVDRSIDADKDVKMNGTHEEEDVKPDIKPSLKDMPSAADRYLSGGWEGWGKRATRKGRPQIGGSSGAAGPVGKMQILRSGKVRMVLGNADSGDQITYDILPGAVPTFQQYLASIAIDDEDRRLHDVAPSSPTAMSVDGDEEEEDRKPKIAGPSLVMLGSVDRKFVARPDIPSLLQSMAKERERVEEQERIKKIKAEEHADEDFDATAGAPAPAPTPKPAASKSKAPVRPRKKAV